MKNKNKKVNKNKKEDKFYFVGAEELDAFLDSSRKEIQVVDDSVNEQASVDVEEVELSAESDEVEVEDVSQDEEMSLEENINEVEEPLEKENNEEVEEDASEKANDDEVEEDVSEDENTDAVEEAVEEDIPDSHTKEGFIVDEGVQEENVIPSVSRKVHKPYFGFEARLIIMFLGILLLLGCACFFIVKAIKYGSNEVVTYDEVSQASYRVCLNENNVYQQSCLDEGMQYLSSLIHDVTASFKYDVNFSTNIDYDLGYHIVGLTRIYDHNDSSKVLYKTEDVLLERIDFRDDSERIHIETQADVDYTKYNKIVTDYKNSYAPDATASLEIILYLDEPNESRSVASITVPLGVQTLNIGKYNLSNVNQSVEIETNRWNEHTAFYGITATVLFLLAMIVLYRMTRLVWKVTNNRNRFQSTLSQILREYDRIIVVARDGYESNIPKKIIKVGDFDDLLDAREALEKPIIYSKVNSVKSEFIVEDDEKLYKYVMKESDF